jgi:hypothetical protein
MSNVKMLWPSRLLRSAIKRRVLYSIRLNTGPTAFGVAFSEKYIRV